MTTEQKYPAQIIEMLKKHTGNTLMYWDEQGNVSYRGVIDALESLLSQLAVMREALKDVVEYAPQYVRDIEGNWFDKAKQALREGGLE